MNDATPSKKVWILVGTRPEVIKQVPLYFECVKRFGAERVALVGTGQHRELLEQALKHFDAKLDFNLDVMRHSQTLSGSAADILKGLDAQFAAQKPEWIVVQGDTTSAAMAAMGGFHHGVRVAHNEAGLRSYDLAHPFPEEANRRWVAVVAELNFAPTEKAKNALLKEGIPADKIFVTGNTGIDALMWTLARPIPKAIEELLAKIAREKRQPILLTAHRRENSGNAVEGWFAALKNFLLAHPDLSLIYPMHPNQMARAAADKHLRPLEQVRLVEAFDYASTCHLLKNCRFVVTDSGGIQEEAATLAVPTVICRKTTERSEAVDVGIARLAGLETASVLEAMEWAYRVSAQKIPSKFPFGEGHASAKIVDILSKA